MSEMADATRRMAHRLTIPVVADADTGHGDLHNVMRCVQEFEGSGRWHYSGRSGVSQAMWAFQQ